jgi:hypothetical protein
MGCYVGNMVVTNARVFGGVIGWWNRKFDRRTEACIRKKHLNRAVDLIQQALQRGLITNVISGQIRADDLATNKVKTKVQLAPRAPFALGFMIFLQPLAFGEDL